MQLVGVTKWCGHSIGGALTITRYSPGRIVVVTIGLAVAGAAFGGIAGAVTLGTVLVLSQGFIEAPRILLAGATMGALLGAGCAPLAGWLVLRHVPLGPAFGGLTLGTTVGGVVGWFIPTLGWLIPTSIDKSSRSLLAGALGFLCAAVVLRIRNARHPSRHVPSDDGAA